MIKKLLMTCVAASVTALFATAAQKKSDDPAKPADTAKTAAEPGSSTTAKKPAAAKKDAVEPKATTAEKKPAAETKPEKKAAEKKSTDVSDADKALIAHAQTEAAKLNSEQKRRLLEVINKGDDKAIEALPGIGEVRAASIKKARPLKSVEDLIMVEGIGEETFDGLVKCAQEGTPAAGTKPAGEADAAKAKEAKPAKPAAEPKAEETKKTKKSS